jgi:phosphonate transport system ATP-binding protein
MLDTPGIGAQKAGAGGAGAAQAREAPATPVAPAVAVENLVKVFGARRVLDGVDIAVEPGSAVALMGANGAGKSTLLRCLIRLVEPTSGRINVLDVDVTSLKGKALASLRSSVGVVFQRHNLVPRLSALSNVVHGVQARARGPRTWAQALARRADRDEAMACLEAVGLADHARQRVDTLSGGQSQRVAIARMLMQRPRLVLADEPDASLDPRAGDEVMSLLFQLAKGSGLTLIFVSHRIEHTIRYSDRIIGLAAGRISLDQPSRDADPLHLRSFFAEPEPPAS